MKTQAAEGTAAGNFGSVRCVVILECGCAATLVLGRELRGMTLGAEARFFRNVRSQGSDLVLVRAYLDGMAKVRERKAWIPSFLT